MNESKEMQSMQSEQRQQPLIINSNLNQSPPTNARQNLDASYGIVARLQYNPNQPELFDVLQQYLNELSDRLHVLETEHEEQGRKLTDLETQNKRLAAELQFEKSLRSPMCKPCTPCDSAYCNPWM